MNIIGHVFEFSSRKLLEEFDQAVDDLLAHFSDKVIIAAAESINRKVILCSFRLHAFGLHLRFNLFQASLWLQNIGSIRACDRITTLNPLIRTINYIFNVIIIIIIIKLLIINIIIALPSYLVYPVISPLDCRGLYKDFGQDRAEHF